MASRSRRPTITEEDVRDPATLRLKLDRAYEEISALHQRANELGSRAATLENAAPAISPSDRKLLDALALIGTDKLLTSLRIGIATHDVLPPTAQAYQNQTVRLASDGQIYTFDEATRLWSGPDATLCAVGSGVLVPSTAYVDVPGLVFTLAAGKTYAFMLVLVGYIASGNQPINIQLAGTAVLDPLNRSMLILGFDIDNSPANMSAGYMGLVPSLNQFNLPGITNIGSGHLYGALSVVTGGTIQVQIASTVALASVDVSAGCFMTAVPL